MTEQLNNVIARAKQLCEWIGQTPHQRGSINGLAAQVGHELHALTTSQPAQAGEVDEPNAKLMELADRIDHEQLWRLSGLAQMDLPQEKQDRVLAGVMLRRYADLLGNDGWRIFPPRPGVSFRARTLDKVVEMARRDEARRSSLPAPQQATPLPFSVVADPSIAPGEAVVKLGGDEVGRLVNIDAQQATPEPDTCRKRPRCGRADPCAWLEKQATQQAAGEPVGEVAAWEYQNQHGNKFLTHSDPNKWHPHDQEGFKSFRPLVYGDTRPAPGVPEGFALVPIKSDDAILRPFYNCPPEELGLAWDAAMRVAQVRLAAAQAKGAQA